MFLGPVGGTEKQGTGGHGSAQKPVPATAQLRATRPCSAPSAHTPPILRDFSLTGGLEPLSWPPLRCATLAPAAPGVLLRRIVSVFIEVEMCSIHAVLLLLGVEFQVK